MEFNGQTTIFGSYQTTLKGITTTNRSNGVALLPYDLSFFCFAIQYSDAELSSVTMIRNTFQHYTATGYDSHLCRMSHGRLQ